MTPTSIVYLLKYAKRTHGRLGEPATQNDLEGLLV